MFYFPLKNRATLPFGWSYKASLSLSPSLSLLVLRSVYMATEVVKGSGVFPKWRTLGVVKAIPLPMCVVITRFQTGCRVCIAVVGKDVFRRYGPYSKILLAEVPEQTAAPP